MDLISKNWAFLKIFLWLIKPLKVLFSIIVPSMKWMFIHSIKVGGIWPILSTYLQLLLSTCYAYCIIMYQKISSMLIILVSSFEMNLNWLCQHVFHGILSSSSLWRDITENRSKPMHTLLSAKVFKTGWARFYVFIDCIKIDSSFKVMRRE